MAEGVSDAAVEVAGVARGSSCDLRGAWRMRRRRRKGGCFFAGDESGEDDVPEFGDEADLEEFYGAEADAAEDEAGEAVLGDLVGPRVEVLLAPPGLEGGAGEERRDGIGHCRASWECE